MILIINFMTIGVTIPAAVAYDGDVGGLLGYCSVLVSVTDTTTFRG